MPKHMAEATNPADAQMQALSAMMGPMLVMMVVMLALMLFPPLRIGLSFSAGSIIEPALPFHSQYFVPTVFVVGSSIMVVNTIIRSFFVDSMKQAHNAHRGKQIGKQLREARMERDTSRINKMQELQMALGPENMATQAEMFRPMMFTIVFIIAIFSRKKPRILGTAEMRFCGVGCLHKFWKRHPSCRIVVVGSMEH